MSARAIASGTISFGLVTIPVKLYSTGEPAAGIHFNWIHRKCGTQVKQRYWCPTDEEYVEEVKKRKEFIKANPQIEHLACPACYLPTPDPAPKKPANTNQTSSTAPAAPAAGGTN